MSALKTKLVRIGNSRGIRLPKVVVEQAGLSGELELEVRRGQLVIRSRRRPREGWEERFREMAARRDDSMLWPESRRLSSFDEIEWEW
ncbi:MAG: AbrB/MazE/SpoVT family DNA-binding domain-containing protein [Thermoanaerobaculia bacterium]